MNSLKPLDGAVGVLAKCTSLDGTKTAQEVFCRYSRRPGWDFSTKADVLVNWFGEQMIEVLLEEIQDAEQAEDFEEFLADNLGEFLADNFGDDVPRNARLPGRRATARTRQAKNGNGLGTARPKTGPNHAVADRPSRTRSTRQTIPS